MIDTDVSYAELVGKASDAQGYRERIEKAGTDFRESQSLFIKSIDLKKRQITALASTVDLDRYNEIILPEAFKEYLPVYMKNPVVITSHQHRLETGSSSVVGNVVNAWMDQKGLWVVVEFVEGTALGEEYWLLYGQKKQRALSVGFKGHESEYQDVDGKRVLVWTKVELLEISCVAVPANPEALSRSKQRKADFVAQKKTESEDEKFLREERAKNPDFDKECEELVELLMSDDIDVVEDSLDTENDFVKLAQGEKKSFAALVAGKD